MTWRHLFYLQDEDDSDDSDESEEETPKKVVYYSFNPFDFLIFLGWMIYCCYVVSSLYFRLSPQKRGRQILLQKHLSLIKRQSWPLLKKLVRLILLFSVYFFWSILFGVFTFGTPLEEWHTRKKLRRFSTKLPLIKSASVWAKANGIKCLEEIARVNLLDREL